MPGHFTYTAHVWINTECAGVGNLQGRCTAMHLSSFFGFFSQSRHVRVYPSDSILDLFNTRGYFFIRL